MSTGKFYNSNENRLNQLTEADWRVALAKCKSHIILKLKQKTLYGAHSSANLGADPIEHYLGLAYEKLLNGDWEWKLEFTLVEQMIRIANSCISKEVDKATSAKGESFKIIYKDTEEFYPILDPLEDPLEDGKDEAKLQIIEAAINGDEQLEFIVEALKEGKKRTEIADLMDLKPRQFDKLKDKLSSKIKKYQSLM